ncbi:MAG: hypothetical protein ACW99J_15820 [Candidatus Thorarchaeota archaeon]
MSVQVTLYEESVKYFNCIIQGVKVIIEVSKDDLDKLRMMLAEGKISSFSEFVSVSIQNQIAIEGGTYELPALESLIGQQSESPDSGRERTGGKRITQELDETKTVKPSRIDDAFPFWGTQNKYLCLKQVTLDFARLSSEEGLPWIRYDVVMNRLLKEAVGTRKRFEAIDKHQHRPRGEKFSTGFPKNDSKSVTRYEKQFIGGIDGDGRPYGMAVEIGFLVARKGKSHNRVEFGITEAGLRFAGLDSPIFRQKESEILPSTPSLSEAEVEFIISHLKESKSSEIDLMRYTLEYIVSGKNRPTDGAAPTKEYLDEIYPNIAKEKKGGEFSMLEASTIRAGVISRLNELGCIRIAKRGTRSEYHVTDSSEDFLTGSRRK